MLAQIDGNGDGHVDATEANANTGLETASPRVARAGMLERRQFITWYKVYDMSPAEEYRCRP